MNSNNVNTQAPTEEGLDFARYFSVLVGRLWVLILLPLIGGGAAYYFSSIQHPSYEATATLLVQQRSSDLSLGTVDFRQNTQIAQTYERLIQAQPFFDFIYTNTEMPVDSSELPYLVSIATSDTPPLMEIKVRHSNPRLAAEVVQLVADQFIQYAIERRLADIARIQTAAAVQGFVNISDLTASQFAAIDSLTLLEPASIPRYPIFPKTRLNVLIGLAAGLTLAVGSVLLMEFFHDVIRSPNEVNRRFGLNLLGTILNWPTADETDGAPIILSAPNSIHAETIRQTRANFEFAAAPQSTQVFMISSPGSGEGKSTIVSNLGVALSQTGKRVIVIEGDLRRPSLHRMFGMRRGGRGLSNILSSFDSEIKDSILETGIDNVDIILAGPNPPNPAELLGSQRMDQLLVVLKKEYDSIIIDSPPSLVLSDGLAIAPKTDGIIIVARAKQTRSSALQTVASLLARTNVPILGVVINDYRQPRFSYGAYGYYYYNYKDYYYYNSASEDSQPSRKVSSKFRKVWSKITS